jgi:succinate dehydrogenase / fumarate reductase cytochrome b subunit
VFVERLLMTEKGFWGTGIWAWLFQRITGLLLVAYLAAHLWTLHFSHITTPFDGFFRYLISNNFVPLLLGIILYHALNGLRTTLIDLGLSLQTQRWMFWALMIAGAALYLYLMVLKTL